VVRRPHNHEGREGRKGHEGRRDDPETPSGTSPARTDFFTFAAFVFVFVTFVIVIGGSDVASV
jgi:hypothetical protein